MTCKDCIHSGLCYKENDYDNFPDRCGSFISNKILEERPHGEWIKTDGNSFECPFCHRLFYFGDNYCGFCGAKMKGGAEK